MGSNKHKNYEILNLIGYGMSKFNDNFIKEFGFSTKTAFYNFCVENKVAETEGTIKNRMDLLDNFSLIMDVKSVGKRVMLIFTEKFL
jgi:hypothetical protein